MFKMSSIRPVILCGGAGTRLWPDSRENFPKQFIPVLNNQSLFDLTINRIKKIKNILKPIIITNKNYKFHVRDALLKQNLDASIILEPAMKNTTPAIYIVSKILNNDDNLIILPSDHYIGNDEIFLKGLNNILKLKQKVKSNWITFGITPNFPSTSYGYLKLNKHVHQLENIYKVDKFIEKPILNDAKKYIKSNTFFWNSGIFIGNTKMIITSINAHAPSLSKRCDKILKKIDYSKLKDVYEFNQNDFDKIPSISIDYSVLEKSKNIYCYPIECDWNDVGSWDRFFKCFPNTKNNKKIIQVKSKNNSNKSNKRKIATIGVEELIVVDSQDAILIAKKGLEESMRFLISTLSKKKMPQLKENVFENRPWGRFENILVNKNLKIKNISVNPKSRLSKQFHNFRSEHWFITKGTALVYKDGKKITLKKGQSIDIPRKSINYIENKSKTILNFIEIQMGTYFSERRY